MRRVEELTTEDFLRSAEGSKVRKRQIHNSLLGPSSAEFIVWSLSAQDVVISRSTVTVLEPSPPPTAPCSPSSSSGQSSPSPASTPQQATGVISFAVGEQKIKVGECGAMAELA